MNIITLIGFLGNKAEDRYTPKQTRVISFSLASTVGKDKQTVWYKCFSFGDQLEKILPYLDKGSHLSVTGELSPPKIYQKKDGQAAVNLSVRICDVKFVGGGKKKEENGQVEMPVFREEKHDKEEPFNEEIPF